MENGNEDDEMDEANDGRVGGGGKSGIPIAVNEEFLLQGAGKGGDEEDGEMSDDGFKEGKEVLGVMESDIGMDMGGNKGREKTQ